MKVFVSFLIAFFITTGLILSAHFNLLGKHKEQIDVTKSEIDGLSYLKILYRLSLNIATLNNKNIKDINTKHLRQKILTNIHNLYIFQKAHPQYINPNFTKELKKLKQFNMTHQDYYNILEFIGLENYRIGDVSKLLFERDRKMYFLSSLATHYMPEYLVSTLITHNIVKELESHSSHYKEDIFTEQTKLLYLSSDEISVILNEVVEYKDSESLLNYITLIIENLNRLSLEIDSQTLFKGDAKSIKKYLVISNEIQIQSYKLNDAYMKIMEKNLNTRLNKLENEIVIFSSAITLLILLISILFLYAYKLYMGREKKHFALIVEQGKTQQALDFRSQFLSNMSHEIRTPLNSIIGLVSVILKTEVTSKQSVILQKIDSAGSLLLGVINDILDIAKIESGKLHIEIHDFDLKKTTTDIINMFSVQAKNKDINLEVKYENINNFNLLGDSLRISQVLTNFISNAIKFTDKGTVLLLIKGMQNNKITFEVQDSGIGLKDKQLETLFEEFTQADMDTTRKYGGTGLGLAISKNLVEMMGSEINVTSEYGVGTSFSFTLELFASKDNNAAELKVQVFDELEDEVNQLQNITILVAEDNKMNQSLLSMLLEDSKLALDFAQDGQIAVDMFKEKNYDLVLMDIQMPNMNGYEATQLIRETNSHVPIIALSANVMREDIEKSLNAGMNGHLAKPIDTLKLYTTLLKFLKS